MNVKNNINILHVFSKAQKDLSNLDWKLRSYKRKDKRIWLENEKSIS